MDKEEIIAHQLLQELNRKEQLKEQIQEDPFAIKSFFSGRSLLPYIGALAGIFALQFFKAFDQVMPYLLLAIIGLSEGLYRQKKTLQRAGQTSRNRKS